METLIQWQDARHAVVAVTGAVEPDDVARLRAIVARLHAVAALELDLHEAAIADVALVDLATGLAADDRPRRCTMRGLCHHHLRLLRYVGVASRHFS